MYLVRTTIWFANCSQKNKPSYYYSCYKKQAEHFGNHMKASKLLHRYFQHVRSLPDNHSSIAFTCFAVVRGRVRAMFFTAPWKTFSIWKLRQMLIIEKWNRSTQRIGLCLLPSPRTKRRKLLLFSHKFLLSCWPNSSKQWGLQKILFLGITFTFYRVCTGSVRHFWFSDFIGWVRNS